MVRSWTYVMNPLLIQLHNARVWPERAQRCSGKEAVDKEKAAMEYKWKRNGEAPFTQEEKKLQADEEFDLMQV